MGHSPISLQGLSKPDFVSGKRVFVAVDQELYRIGVVSRILGDKRLNLVGESTNLLESCDRVSQTKPDLIIRDLYAVEVENNLFLDLDSACKTTTSTIVFTAGTTGFEFVQCSRFGIKGVLCRNVGSLELINSIHEVIAGNIYYCGESKERYSKTIQNGVLTMRELEILQYLALGLSNKEIAKKLELQVGTVKTHLINIMTKLEVNSRTAAVVRGIQLQLIRI